MNYDVIVILNGEHSKDAVEPLMKLAQNGDKNQKGKHDVLILNSAHSIEDSNLHKIYQNTNEESFFVVIGLRDKSNDNFFHKLEKDCDHEISGVCLFKDENKRNPFEENVQTINNIVSLKRSGLDNDYIFAFLTMSKSKAHYHKKSRRRNY